MSCKHGLPGYACAVCNNAVRPDPDPWRGRQPEAKTAGPMPRHGTDTLRRVADAERLARWGQHVPPTYAPGPTFDTNPTDIILAAPTGRTSAWRQSVTARTDALDLFLKGR